MKRWILLLYLLATCLPGISAQTPGMISGEIINQHNREPIPSCNISVEPTGQGAVSDSLGLFVLQLPLGQFTLEFSHVGFVAIRKTVLLTAENPKIRLTIKMIPQIIEGQPVTILDKREQSAPGVQELGRQEIRRMPTLYSDVLRTITILPGVSSNNELSSAYNVRGGNFDENLIYLNGYEIYRPFLLRQGVEENQSLVNPDLVENLQFYGGGFPANLGDKMSSALEVNYRQSREKDFAGTARADFFNVAFAACGLAGKLRWSGGARYANPDWFVSKLQTSGSYQPFFADVQALLSYPLSPASNLELFFLNARNRFDLTPANWTGNFKFGVADVKAVDIEYSGERNYTFHTGLIGLKFDRRFGAQTHFRISLAGYSTREDEDAHLASNIFYDNDVLDDTNQGEFLKSRLEKANNSLDMQTYEVQSSLKKIISRHTVGAGVNIRFINLENHLDEFFQEEGEESLVETPQIERADQNLNLTYLSAFLQEVFSLNQKWQLALGLRALHFNYNRETILSPRGSLQFFADARNTFSFSGGFYSQPPFFYELRNKNLENQSPLKSQRAIHYLLRWEHRFDKNLDFQTEVFYKKLENLVPYYLDQLKIIYADENSHQGFAYGFDILLKGEIVKSLNSWIGYGFLKTREKTITGGPDYNRRLLDQTHTLRIFLQDKIPQYPHIQAHLRMLFGSGYLYHPQTPVTDEITGDTLLAVNFDRRDKFQAYSRFDLGMSARLNWGKQKQVVLVAEVLNVFNHINVAAYSWFQPLPGQPVKVPHIFTRRFFNAGIEVDF